jgi:hypothetical protein
MGGATSLLYPHCILCALAAPILPTCQSFMVTTDTGKYLYLSIICWMLINGKILLTGSSACLFPFL